MVCIQCIIRANMLCIQCIIRAKMVYIQCIIRANMVCSIQLLGQVWYGYAQCGY